MISRSVSKISDSRALTRALTGSARVRRRDGVDQRGMGGGGGVGKKIHGLVLRGVSPQCWTVGT
jgi:hypothetical protein